MIDSNLMLCVFDAILVGSDDAMSCAQFRAGDLVYGMSLSSPSHWTVGTIGVLRFNDDGICTCFSAYPDQRLRRAPGRDDASHRRWGWAIEDHTFSVRAGLVPGLAGAVVPDECAPLEVPIPPEFTQLCQDHDLDPLEVLRAFIADLSQITDSRRCPREDGYCSSGADERFLAREYFRRAHRSLRLSAAWLTVSGLR